MPGTSSPRSPSGKLGAAAWAAVGFIPGPGDAAKMARKIQQLIARFPGQKAQLIKILQDVLPQSVEREALDLVTNGGYSALIKSGLSSEAVDRMVRRGTDINKLRGLAKVSERTLDAADTAALKTRIAKWPPNRRAEEAWGVETALMELERNPAIDDPVRRPPGRRPALQRTGHRRLQPRHRARDRRRGQGRQAGLQPALVAVHGRQAVE